MKKPASDENRARLEDMHHRRPSTPHREPFRRSSSEVRRAEEQRRMEDQRRAEDRAEEQRRLEDQRRANENYHPSEAAHHPPPHLPPNHLPPLQQGPSSVHTPVHELPPPPPPAPKDYPIEERERLDHPPPPPPPVGEPERAARKMDVDEDYDDEGEEDKKGGILSATGSAPGSATRDANSSSPTGVNGHAVNGVPNGQPKTETAA